MGAETPSPDTLIERLTPRERQILELIAQGLTSTEIAAALFRSRRTVESHRQSIGRKLAARNRIELTRLAIQSGLAPLEGADMEQLQQIGRIGTWIWEPEPDRLHLDPVLRRLTGMEEDPPRSLKCWRDRLSPTDADADRDALSRHLSGESERYEVIYRLPHSGQAGAALSPVPPMLFLRRGQTTPSTPHTPVRLVGVDIHLSLPLLEAITWSGGNA